MNDADVAWNCPICADGLTAEDKKSISAAVFKQLRVRHRRRVHKDVQTSKRRKLCARTYTTLYRQQQRMAVLNMAPAKRHRASILDPSKFEFCLASVGESQKEEG